MAELEIKPSAAVRGRVAGVILSAILISGVLIYLLTAGGGDLLAPRVTLVTFLPDSEGLAVNSPVRLSGIKIGLVRKVELSPYLDPQRAVRVEMLVRESFLTGIPSDSQTAITADTLIGDKVISISEGKSRVPVAAGATLASEPIKIAADQSDLIRAVGTELRTVDQLMADLSNPATPTGSLIMGDAEYQRAMAQITGFSRTVHGLVGPNSGAGQLIYSSDLYDRIHQPLLELDKRLDAIEASKLITSSQQYDDLVALLQKLRNTLAATGLERDSPAYARLQQLLVQADKTISALKLGRPETLESLYGQLNHLQTLLRDLRENPRKYLRAKVF